MRIPGYTIETLKNALDQGDVSAAEVFTKYQKKIEDQKDLNAFLSVHEYKEPVKGELSGVPAGIKDNMLIEGTIATSGSKILNNYISAYDATVIKKLKAAGVTMLGKTNMDEFAMGSSTENSGYGRVKHPLDPALVSGGSSGGSAAAVAADLCVFALGSDTGGSIRQPAALCGVVGLKPTYGRVSRHGLMALASSLDQIGTFTKTVKDTALVLNVIAGHDELDSTTVPVEVPDFTKNLEKDGTGLRVGVPKEFFGVGLSAEVEEKVRMAIDVLKRSGATIKEISLPHAQYALAVYYIVMPCEASANLARFDGIRYGHSSKKAANLLETYLFSRAEGFGLEPKRRIMLGAYALSAGYFDAYYLKAQKVRALIKKDFDDAFKDVDVIVGPTTPTVAFKAGEKSDDPLAMYLSDIYTVPVNLAGLPGISVPCGDGAASNLPVGLQIIGKSFDETTLLQAAAIVERAQA
jgi:aspartyl-tRNA(Asn)/glutamyl-tRNA(Gln) amidotransferase subunit A